MLLDTSKLGLNVSASDPEFPYAKTNAMYLAGVVMKFYEKY